MFGELQTYLEWLEDFNCADFSFKYLRLGAADIWNEVVYYCLLFTKLDCVVYMSVAIACDIVNSLAVEICCVADGNMFRFANA